MNAIRVLFVSTLCWTIMQGLKLPDYITPCHYNAPDVDECILKTARATVPHIINGDPKYKVPPLDPALIKELIVKQGTESVGLVINAHDAYVHGGKDAEIKDLKIDFKNKKFTLDVYVPELRIIFIYNVTGKILLLPIEGYGNGSMVLSKVRGVYTYDWDIKKLKDGKEHYTANNPKLTFDTEKFRIHLENLFHGNKLLGDNMNRFMNENWKEIIKEVGPALADGLSKYVRQIVNNIYALVPVEEVFIHDHA